MNSAFSVCLRRFFYGGLVEISIGLKSGEQSVTSNPYLLTAAVLIICCCLFFRAFRWGAFLKPLGAARFGDLFAATTIGFSGVFLIGRAGEFVRPVVLPMRDPQVRPSASLVTIIVERIYDFTAVALMFAINLLWFRPPFALGVSFDRVRVVGFGLLAAIILGIAFLMWFRKRSSLVLNALEGLFSRRRIVPKRLAKIVLQILEQLAQALQVLVNRRELAETIGWTALLWFGIASANLLVMRAFHLPVGFTETIFVLGWSLVGSLVPTPGGAAGAFHAATAAGLLFLRRKAGDSRGAVDRFTSGGFWSSTIVCCLLSDSWRSEFLKVTQSVFRRVRWMSSRIRD